jgi:D-beta-D-heptose 7-phosphate kinase/D-beta-D-heptose 1-phosphate adenosyltransferase
MNITGLGAEAILIGFAGRDADCARMEELLRASGVEPLLVQPANFRTISKTRVVADHQQIVRIDVEQTEVSEKSAYDRLLSLALEQAEGCHALILSDYAKGVLTEDLCQKLIECFRKAGKPILVDPKQSSFLRYRGATTVCPNLKELATALGESRQELHTMLDHARRLVPHAGLENLIVTLSEHGIAVVTAGEYSIAPAQARQITDVSGAGDTAIATLALAAAVGLPVQSAIRLANITAGIVVAKLGTAPIDHLELMAALSTELALNPEEKSVNLQQLIQRVLSWKNAGEKIVFTNGCFDLLHVGHIRLLEEARRQGDRLVLGINSDRSVKRLKGPKRPVMNEAARARVLSALAAVDAVVVFDQDTPLELILALQPDVLVKGSDNTESTVVGAELLHRWGGRVHIVPMVEGYSTAAYVEKMAAKN